VDNLLVAVKIRSAAVHAALAECPSDKKIDCIYVNADTRIQVLDTMVLLPQAEKEQNAAFIMSARSCPSSALAQHSPIMTSASSWCGRCHAPNVFGTVDMEKVSR